MERDGRPRQAIKSYIGNIDASEAVSYTHLEGNYALPSILAGARQMERDGRPRQAIKSYIGSIDVSEGQ